MDYSPRESKSGTQLSEHEHREMNRVTPVLVNGDLYLRHKILQTSALGLAK